MNTHQKIAASGTKTAQERTKPGRGGYRPGAGAKPVAGVNRSIKRSFRFTPAESAALDELGGADWIRGQIEHAGKQEREA